MPKQCVQRTQCFSEYVLEEHNMGTEQCAKCSVQSEQCVECAIWSVPLQCAICVAVQCAVCKVCCVHYVMLDTVCGVQCSLFHQLGHHVYS